MRYASKHTSHAATPKRLTTLRHQLEPYRSSRRLSILTLLVGAIITPAQASAALPEAIQTALLRAELTESDISMIVTPVGHKDASHLPTPIQVINSSADLNQPALPTGSEPHSTLVTIEQRTIEKHEKNLHSYTDDPYTYQSVESIPTVIADAATRTQNPDIDNADNNAINDTTNVAKNVDKADNTSIKISFSPLLNHQSDIPRTPASTMKLVPSFIALDTLGADFVWHTRVYHTGIVVGDRLQGDLIIQGSGDPKMTHERLKQLLYQVQASGIRHIDGDIIIDSAVFNQVSKDPAAFDNAPLRPYNASPDGFLVNFSTIGIKTQPLEGDQAALTYKPRLANYQLPATLNTRSAACRQAPYSLDPQWQKQQLLLNADLPKSCGEHVFYVAYPDAKEFAAHVLAAKWQALGNTLSGKVISQEAPYHTRKAAKPYGLTAISMSPLPIASYPSLNLTQQIYDINHFSNNVMTEQVALSIGAYKATNIANTVSVSASTSANTTDDKQTGQPATGEQLSHEKPASLYEFGRPNSIGYPLALQTIDQWWKRHLNTPAPYLTNGSGLCRECTISAANLSELLTYAYDHASFDAYVHSLGVAGVSGTIAAHSERLPTSAAIGRAWIKTGTLNNVTSMAGYVKGRSGQDYVVVGMINTEQALNPYTARPVLDAMLDWTAQH